MTTLSVLKKKVQRLERKVKAYQRAEKEKTKRHEVVLVIRADAPCTLTDAVRMVRESIHGTFSPPATEAGVQEFIVKSVRRTLTNR